MISIGDKALITCLAWFYAPDGQSYNAVFGTVKAVRSSEETLGIKTNAKSTNWYIEIGDMTIAGCQVNYAIKTSKVSFCPYTVESSHEGRLVTNDAPRSRIYDADKAERLKKAKLKCRKK